MRKDSKKLVKKTLKKMKRFLMQKTSAKNHSKNQVEKLMLFSNCKIKK